METKLAHLKEDPVVEVTEKVKHAENHTGLKCLNVRKGAEPGLQ